MSELCETHKLVAAPDGRCVVCRRPKLTLLRNNENESALSKVVTAALGLGVLVAMAALAYASTTPTARASSSGSRSIASASLLQRANGAARGSDSEQADLQPVNVDAQDAVTEPAVELVATETENANGERRSKKRPRTVGARIVDPRLAAARREVVVTMYSAPWCFICDRARAFLEAREVEVIEHDVDREPRAQKELEAINAAGSIPTFVVDRKTIVGFHPWGLEDAIDRVAQERFCVAPAKLANGNANVQGAVCERLVSAR